MWCVRLSNGTRRRRVIEGDVRLCNEGPYHQNCVMCTACMKPLKKAVATWDAKEMCGSCFNKLPRDVQKRINKLARDRKKAEQELRRRQKEELIKAGRKV